MNKNQIIQVVAVILMIASLASTQLLTGRIYETRKKNQLVEVEATSGTVPPDVALLSAVLGPFRGLAVDVLWYRANAQKEAGKYYEANQLSQWITKLQPRFAQVWAFHAWNMAYNISVATYTPDERWDWVNKGIVLLRNHGIPANPHAVRLYKELAWIYFHKIGQMSDDMHWYYKSRLAHEWELIVGGPVEGMTTEQTYEEFRKIADSPEKLQDLVKTNPGVQKLVDKFAEINYSPNKALLERIAGIQIVRKALGAEATPEIMTARMEAYDKALDAILTNPNNKDDLALFQNFLRRQTIVEFYHMDPVFMLKLMEIFGPLDWRHTSSHGLYWANLGTKMADISKNKKDIDLLNTYRQNVHSIQDLVRFGCLIYDPMTEHIDMLPDPRFIPMYEKALNYAKEALKQQPGINMLQVEENYAAGFENFLQQAITFSYLYGNVPQAEKYFAQAKKMYANRIGHQYQGYRMTLPEMIVDQLAESGDLMANAHQFIDAMILKGITQGLANGRADIFDQFFTVSKGLYERFQAKSIDTPIATQSRMKLLPFDELFSDCYLRYMREPNVSIGTRARVWDASPVALKLRVYDKLLTTVNDQLLAMKIEPARAFPPPPGIEEFRKKKAQEAAIKKEAPGLAPVIRQ